MRWALALLMAGTMTLGYAEEACRREERGQLRPAGIHQDAKLRKRALACDVVRMCTSNEWGQLRWMGVSTPYWKLAGRPAPEGCSTTTGASLAADNARALPGS